MKHPACVWGVVSSCLFAHAAHAQTYPVKPIRIVVAYAAGGANDLVARTAGQKLSERVGQQVIVDNRPGAASNIGSDHVAKSPPDGYTILLGSSANAINITLYSKLPYDPLKDLAPVTLLAVNPYLFVVHPSLPAKSAKDFIALARARPGQIAYASSGSGGATHLTAELLKLTAKIDILHVPYKGGGPAMIDLAGGHVVAMFENMITAIPYAQTGKVRALAVTSLQRSEILPDVPTVAEGGISGFESLGWFGIFAPANTPRDVVSRLNTEFAAVVRAPDMAERLKSQGVTAVGNSPADFDKFFRDYAAKWGKVVKASGARVD